MAYPGYLLNGRAPRLFASPPQLLSSIHGFAADADLVSPRPEVLCSDLEGGVVVAFGISELPYAAAHREGHKDSLGRLP